LINLVLRVFSQLFLAYEESRKSKHKDNIICVTQEVSMSFSCWLIQCVVFENFGKINTFIGPEPQVSVVLTIFWNKSQVSLQKVFPQRHFPKFLYVWKLSPFIFYDWWIFNYCLKFAFVKFEAVCCSKNYVYSTNWVKVLVLRLGLSKSLFLLGSSENTFQLYFYEQ